jgi:hypothetical protein
VTPRRFVLSGAPWDMAVVIDGPRLDRETLPVREDIITEQDVEVVKDWLMAEGRLNFRTVPTALIDARDLLSLVLGSDKEGEDA